MAKTKMQTKRRTRIIVKGTVQGVGFRPAVYRYAKGLGLAGLVYNTPDGVIIEVEGNAKKISNFIGRLEKHPPKNAVISEIKTQLIPLKKEKSFHITSSKSKGSVSTRISADICTCEDCLKEMNDKKDRRYLYPFINCINCGPRFTMIEGVPYDRQRTTMKKFVMCKDCKREYEEPSDRRFHAQPVACPVCGPEVELLKNNYAGGQYIEPENTAGLINQAPTIGRGTSAVRKGVELLKAGKILAIKGLGGFHLACDATNDKAVKNLRSRKFREDKPFAVMARDINTIEKYFKLSKKEKELLVSSKRSIVLIKNFPSPLPSPLEGEDQGEGARLSGYIAPSNKYIGLMLPYTPIHHLLFKFPLPLGERSKVRGKFIINFLVMTSGNRSDEPICYSNKDALKRLGGIADYFLVHDRDIYVRCDDSVTRCFHGKEMITRRSRGYVPAPVKSPVEMKKNILACGAHLKNTFCLAKKDNIYISHHVGDLENTETLSAFEKGIEHFKKIFEIEPGIIAHDMHPEYLSTKYASNYKSARKAVKLIAVQHHHAHIASCLADNIIRGNLKLKQDEKVIGVAFDGTGYGEDGNIWGGEILIAGFKEYQRYARLDYIPMPGGEKAIKEPWRMAVSYLYKIFGNGFLDLGIEFTKEIDRDKWEVMHKMLDTGVNSPLTSSMGRLFDAVSALTGIRAEINYEGQAAVELEQSITAESEKEMGCYIYEILDEKGMLVIDIRELFIGILKDLQNKVSVAIISARFHNTVVSMIVSFCLEIRKKTGINKVALSGGVFQNIFLLDRAYNSLLKKGFVPLVHSLVPANDGGLCLGQVLIAANQR